MSKPSFTTQEQVAHLAEKWNIDQDRARQMLRDVRNMYRDALARKERVYIDDLFTITVRAKNRGYKTVPGQGRVIVPARLDIKAQESETLVEHLKPFYKEELRVADWE